MKFKVKKKMKSMLILSFFVFAWSFNLGANVFASNVGTRYREKLVDNIYEELKGYKEAVESLREYAEETTDPTLKEKIFLALDCADDTLAESVNYSGVNNDGTEEDDDKYNNYEDPLAQLVDGDNAGKVENVDRWGPGGDIRATVAENRYYYSNAFLESAPADINKATNYLKEFKK